jgi:hypothetical protein
VWWSSVISRYSATHRSCVTFAAVISRDKIDFYRSSGKVKEAGRLTVPNWHGCMLYNTKMTKLSYGVIKWPSRATRMLQSQITPLPHDTRNKSFLRSDNEPGTSTSSADRQERNHPRALGLGLGIGYHQPINRRRGPPAAAVCSLSLPCWLRCGCAAVDEGVPGSLPPGSNSGCFLRVQWQYIAWP